MVKFATRENRIMKFSDIAGHEMAKNYLRSLIENDRIPHSLLISGPPGIGKLQLARAFAQYVHCTNRRDGESCGECPSCRQHQRHNFPDLLFSFPVHGTKGGNALVSDDYMAEWNEFLDSYPLAQYEKWLELMGADNTQPQIKVRESDEIIRKITLSNFLADKKILIMWLPEKLHPAAANKLLKIIEEPTDGNLFIFVSNSPGEILPTIFSRTQRLNLRPLSADEVTDYLVSRHGLSEEDARNVAGISGGSPLQAENLISLQTEEEEFRNYFRDLMRRAYMRDVEGLKEWSEKVAGLKREKSRRFISYAARMLRENFVYNIGNRSLNVMAAEDESFSKNFAPFINEKNVTRILKELDDADRDIRGNGNAKIIFFDFAVQLIILIKK